KINNLGHEVVCRLKSNKKILVNGEEKNVRNGQAGKVRDILTCFPYSSPFYVERFMRNTGDLENDVRIG
ncbi:hypothetical protein AKJ41_01945, partial [candidate division MSBL1 archaeon SCGC-AAA259O05]